MKALVVMPRELHDNYCRMVAEIDVKVILKIKME